MRPKYDGNGQEPLEAMTWAEFQELFMGKYFPEIAKAQEFLELKQGAMTMMDYVARFT